MTSPPPYLERLLAEARALYEKRIHGENGLTVRDYNRIDDILTIDLPRLVRVVRAAQDVAAANPTRYSFSALRDALAPFEEKT